MADKVKKFSRKRSAIKDLLCSTKTHPAAEWIYRQLKPDLPDLSIATVYRNLNEMKMNGEIQSVAFVGGKERYDGVPEQHSHFICDSCGKIEDLEYVPYDVSLDDIARFGFGGNIDYHTLVFHGLCKDCSSIKN